jgi:hypothetical protein
MWLRLRRIVKTITSTMWRLEGDFVVFKSKRVRRSKEISNFSYCLKFY